jgi:hypothetical protein
VSASIAAFLFASGSGGHQTRSFGTSLTAACASQVFAIAHDHAAGLDARLVDDARRPLVLVVTSETEIHAVH